jgi:hypothetical protein
MRCRAFHGIQKAAHSKEINLLPQAAEESYGRLFLYG